MKTLAVTVTFLFLLTMTSVFLAAEKNDSEKNQAGSENKGKLSGYMFGDFYYVASSHNKDIEGQNGFWFRRIYFTYDKNISEQFSIRLRLELNSPGDFETKAKVEPYAKDAHLRWKKNGHSIILGISPTLTFEYIDKFWGYRSVEKSPLDLLKFNSSRDFGISFKGPLDESQKVHYAFMLANGSGSKSEINKEKLAMTAFRFDFSENVTFEAYADWHGYPDHFDRCTFQGFFGYKTKNRRIGMQFSRQTRQNGRNNKNLNLEIFSLFYIHNFSDKANGIFRMDYNFDPIPEGNEISYIPFDTRAKSKFFLVGLEYLLDKNVHIVPNLELIHYSEKDGVKPDMDVIPRITYYYTW